MKAHSVSEKRKRVKWRGGILYLLGTISSFLITGTTLFTLAMLSDANLLDFDNLALFFSAAVGAIGVLANAKLYWFRTFVHEIKHAVVVVLTGSKIRGFKVHRRTGMVNYTMYADRVYLTPLICLAPYYLPLVSLPVFAFCVFFEATNGMVLSPLLGIAFSFDLQMAFRDLHSEQSDLRQVVGGAPFALAFIGGMNAMWLSILCLWLGAGESGLLYGAFVLWDLVSAVVKSRLSSASLKEVTGSVSHAVLPARIAESSL